MRSHFHESRTQSISESIISLFKCILALRIENVIYIVCIQTSALYCIMAIAHNVYYIKVQSNSKVKVLMNFLG